MKKNLLLLMFLCAGKLAMAQNPIIPNQGINDPHIKVFNDTAYLYASHDKSIDNKKFIMPDWMVWSSPDLVNWTKRSVLKPEDTFIGKPFDGCWATDIAYKNGKYYWYLSEENNQTGVVVGDTPVGPWKDPLGKPLLSADLTPTREYDISVIEDNGEHYIIFGIFNYYIAKLNNDMISLAEKPRKLDINNARGPYSQYGENDKIATDDKPSLHKYNGKYYLSWGCFYAMADNLYGPYDYKGSVMKETSFAKGYDAPTWPHGFVQGRHGSFFEWHNQWYFAYCDISQTDNRYFRDTFISYIHYKDNGEIADIRVDGTGVGRYDASKGMIEAEDYFKAVDVEKDENVIGGFSVNPKKNGAYVVYPNIKGLAGKDTLNLEIYTSDSISMEVRENSAYGNLLFTCEISKNNTYKFENRHFVAKGLKDGQSLCFVFKGVDGKTVRLNRFGFE